MAGFFGLLTGICSHVLMLLSFAGKVMFWSVMLIAELAPSICNEVSYQASRGKDLTFVVLPIFNSLYKLPL